jgi:hypothetical protein
MKRILHLTATFVIDYVITINICFLCHASSASCTSKWQHGHPARLLLSNVGKTRSLLALASHIIPARPSHSESSTPTLRGQAGLSGLTASTHPMDDQRKPLLQSAAASPTITSAAATLAASPSSACPGAPRDAAPVHSEPCSSESELVEDRPQSQIKVHFTI